MKNGVSHGFAYFVVMKNTDNGAAARLGLGDQGDGQRRHLLHLLPQQRFPYKAQGK